MKCNEIVRLLPSFLDGELAGRAQVMTSEHLASCPACRLEFDGLRSDVAFLRSTAAREPNPYLVTRVMAEVRQRGRSVPRGFGRLAGTLAAALVVAVSIGAGIFFGSGLAANGARETGTTETAAAYVESSTTELYSFMAGGN